MCISWLLKCWILLMHGVGLANPVIWHPSCSNATNINKRTSIHISTCWVIPEINFLSSKTEKVIPTANKSLKNTNSTKPTSIILNKKSTVHRVHLTERILIFKERRNQLDATNSNLLVINSISTCFGHLYAHHQEIQLRSTAYSCLSCCSCCDAGESVG